MLCESLMVRDLLEGCLVSAIPSDAVPPVWDLQRYIDWLHRSYHTMKATPDALRKVAGKFTAVGDHHAAQYASRSASEETGHHLLALRDLKELSCDLRGIVQQVPPATRRLLDTLDGFVSQEKPYGIFGYAYVLERASLAVTREDLARLAALAPGRDICRARRLHSGAGQDANHLAELVDLIAGFDRDARLTVMEAIQIVVPVALADSDSTKECAA